MHSEFYQEKVLVSEGLEDGGGQRITLRRREVAVRRVITGCELHINRWRSPAFNTQQFYVLPTQCIYVFSVDLRTNSDYFPIQH